MPEEGREGTDGRVKEVKIMYRYHSITEWVPSCE